MQLDIMSGPLSMPQMAETAAAVEAAGFGGLWLTEGGREAFLPSGAAAMATDSITLGTGVAVAFPRSPMITAQNAWQLAEASNGRFVLGLGTQVKAHVERRYGTPYSHPGPRMREYVQATKAIFRAFRGEEKLLFEGDYYQFSLLPAQWSPGPIGPPDPDVYISAVLPYMSRVAGEVCDGVHVHPFHSPRYLSDVQIPAVTDGVQRAGRSLNDITFVCPVMTAVGDTEEQATAAREHARSMIAFYGSTRTYSPVFELHGFVGLSDQLHAKQREGDIAGMVALINDEVLDNYIVSGTWDSLGPTLVARYGNLGVNVRVMSYTAMGQINKDPSSLERWAAVAAAMRG